MTIVDTLNLALALQKTGNNPEAKELLRARIPVAERSLGREHYIYLKLRWLYANSLCHWLLNGANEVEFYLHLIIYNYNSQVEISNFCSNYLRIYGEQYHSPNQGELINLQNLGTSIYAKRDLEVDEKTTLKDYDIQAPRVGISVGDFSTNFEGKPLISPVKKGEVLTLRHFSNGLLSIPENVREFSRLLHVGLPVRLHDYLRLKETFNLSHYEFHLSFSETFLGTNLLKLLL